MLAHEQFPVPELVQLGVTAEQAGFDLLATSDHLQPWQANERHSGQAWVTMSAIGERTHRVWIGPTVTCPTFRYNPAVVAEAFSGCTGYCSEAQRPGTDGRNHDTCAGGHDHAGTHRDRTGRQTGYEYR